MCQKYMKIKKYPRATLLMSILTETKVYDFGIM